MTKEATYGKARELFDQLHHTGRWSGNGEWKGTTVFDKIAYYVAGSSSKVGVWKIPLKELRYLQWERTPLIPLVAYSLATVPCGIGYMKQQKVIAAPGFSQVQGVREIPVG
ncbi:hypothetical protein C5167_020486 [Papaver somniferum]|uniref:Uncharacterized protein n=1 Tax=Papaver somniferum TaxID=3469 RepID=A0A4Y7IX57_PAPSO|nr:hypothetical protein C5167_020486 [Papaver somniferum]